MWYKHFCFINMGNHFFTMDPSIDADAATGCDTAVPLQMVYHDNILNAFVWQHVADIPGDRWVSIIHKGIFLSKNAFLHV